VPTAGWKYTATSRSSDERSAEGWPVCRSHDPQGSAPSPAQEKTDRAVDPAQWAACPHHVSPVHSDPLAE
jgi:hypothetical protein